MKALAQVAMHQCRNQVRTGRRKETQANVNVHVPAQLQHSCIQQRLQPISHQSQANRDDDMLTVMQKQNVITKLLLKQQQLSQLPTKDISVFKGDALWYKLFMRAFEHAIEQKTDDTQDKLYFLEQFTDSEPQEIAVTS